MTAMLLSGCNSNEEEQETYSQEETTEEKTTEEKTTEEKTDESDTTDETDGEDKSDESSVSEKNAKVSSEHKEAMEKILDDKSGVNEVYANGKYTMSPSDNDVYKRVVKVETQDFEDMEYDDERFEPFDASMELNDDKYEDESKVDKVLRHPKIIDSETDGQVLIDTLKGLNDYEEVPVDKTVRENLSSSLENLLKSDDAMLKTGGYQSSILQLVTADKVKPDMKEAVYMKDNSDNEVRTDKFLFVIKSTVSGEPVMYMVGDMVNGETMRFQNVFYTNESKKHFIMRYANK